MVSEVLVPSRGYLFLNGELLLNERQHGRVLVPSRGYLFLNNIRMEFGPTRTRSRPLSGISISQFVMGKALIFDMDGSRPLSGISISQ